MQDALLRAGLDRRPFRQWDVWWVNDADVFLPSSVAGTRKLHDERPVVIVDGPVRCGDASLQFIQVAPTSHLVKAASRYHQDRRRDRSAQHNVLTVASLTPNMRGMPKVTRSPNYPAISLSDARELARRLYDREKRSPADAEEVVRAWGYSGLSGPARTKLSALRKYGLLEGTDRGMQLTDLAMALLYPNDPREEADALQAAATQPELFRELASFPGASDDNLTSRLVRLGFTPAGARSAVASYRETMSIVSSETSDYNTRHDSTPATATDSIPRLSDSVKTTVYPSTATGAGSAGDASIALSVGLPGGARMDFRVTGGEPNAEALALIRSYLDMFEKSVSVPKAKETGAASPSLALVPTEQQPPGGQSPDDAPG